jgi:tetratricopeptide (TPR) repeat protein
MAGKVNYRFVAVLCAILIACTLGVVGLWYTFVHTDPAEAIARADGAFEKGQYALASSLYGKALAKRPNNIDLIIKYADSIKPIKVSDVRTARDTVQRLQGAYRKALQIDPVHPQAFEHLMDLTLRIGRDLGDFDAWNQMVRTATSSLAVDGTFTLAHKYRGLAQVNLMEAIDVLPDDRDRARSDLQAANKAFPKDVQVAYHLVRWHLVQARKLARSGNQPDEVNRHHQLALKLSNELLGHGPTDPLRRLYHIRVLTVLEKHDQAVALFTKLETQLLKKAKPADVVLAVADRIAFIANKPGNSAQSLLGRDGLKRTEALLRAAIARYPSDLRFNTSLGRMMSLQGRYDDAMQILEHVMEKPLVATPVNLLRDADLQKRALAQHADLILTRAKTMPLKEKQLALKQVDEVVRKLQGTTGKSALVYLMEGKLHMVREQWPVALVKLDRAIAMFKGQNPEALLYAATCCIKLGEPGAAIDRLEKLVELRENYMPARYELMRLHLQLSQYGRLSNQIQATLSLAPNDFESQ